MCALGSNTLAGVTGGCERASGFIVELKRVRHGRWIMFAEEGSFVIVLTSKLSMQRWIEMLRKFVIDIVHCS